MRNLLPLTAASRNEQPAPAWLFWATTALVFLVSFICEQNLRISTQFAYTQTLDEMTVTAEGGNALRRITFLALGCGGIALLLASLKKPWNLNLPLLIALLLVPAWCVLSLTWAIDFGMTARRLIVLLCCVAGAVGIGRTFSLPEICRMCFYVALATVLVGIGAEVAQGTFRPWSGDYRFSGSVHPNTQGMYLSLLILSSFTLGRSVPQHRTWFWAWCGIGVVLLVLTKSRTATAALMLTWGSLWLMQTNWRWQLILGGSAAWSAAVIAMLVFMMGIDVEQELKSAVLLGREEQAESLTGRGEIWPEVLKHVAASPLIGHGFESFWTPANITRVSDTLEWPVREAHNGYLESLLHLGAIGLFLGSVAVLLGLACSVAAYLRTGDPHYAFVGGLIIFGLLDATMESGMITPQTVVFMLCACLLQISLGRGLNVVPQPAPRRVSSYAPVRVSRSTASPAWK